MYELIRISEHDAYMDCPAKVGFIKTGEDKVVLIDSGSDESAGKKVLRLAEANGWKIDAVFNTHSHADHIGGNAFLKARTGCRLYAAGIERDFAKHTLLEPVALYGGCPGKDLKNKFLMAKPSETEYLAPDCLPEGLTMIDLPGHSFEMCGFRTADDTVFLADALASRETIEKYGIPYVWDVGAYLATLERICAMEAKMFVPAHAEVTEQIEPLARFNIEATNETAEKVLTICGDGMAFDGILKRVFDVYGLALSRGQHALIGSTVRGYLTYLEETGQLECLCENNVLVWRRK